MEKTISVKRIMAVAIVMALALIIPDAANAKWSKASTKFTCDGISVEVVDRHQWVGAMFDTYGYAIYKNETDSAVTVHWRSYGLLRNGHKFILTEEDQFDLYPKEERKEVYSYTGGRFTERDVDKYVISIEVVPLEAVQEVIDPKDIKIYNIYSEYEEKGKLSQEDYAKSIVWMRWFFNDVFYPFFDEMKKKKPDMNDSSQRHDWYSKYYLDVEPWMPSQWRVGKALQESSDKGLLDEENKKAWKELKAEIKKYIDANKKILIFNTELVDYDKY